MSVYAHYTGDEPIGMDHPLFMARFQARMSAGWAMASGMPLADALRSVRAEIQALFGDVPLALIDSVVVQEFALRAAQDDQPGG